MPDVSNTEKEINIASADIPPELHGSLGNRGGSPSGFDVPVLPSTPHFGLQFFTCTKIGDTDPKKIQEYVRKALNKPDADVRSECHSNQFKIYAWLDPTSDPFVDQKRKLAMEKVSILQPGSLFTQFINKSTVERYVRIEWDKLDKRYNDDFSPDPSGPLHLTGHSVEFKPDNQFITRIKGYHETPWPDVSFEVKLTDTFSIADQQDDNPIDNNILIESTSSLDIDTSLLNWLALLGVLTTNPLPVVVFGGQSAIIALFAPNSPGKIVSLGEFVRRSFVSEIYYEGGKKLVFNYKVVRVKNGGIFAGGDPIEMDRAPNIREIWGPRSIRVPEGVTTATAQYWLFADDLRPKYHIVWSVDDTPIASIDADELGEATKTWITFSSVGATSRVPVARKLSVRVTDPDNSPPVNLPAAELALTVNIFSTPPVDPDEPTLPPICRIRPWLPQCNPDEPV